MSVQSRGTETSSALTGSDDSRRSLSTLIRRPEAGSLIGTVVVFIFFAIFGGPLFMSAQGTASWLNVAAELGIIAIPVGLLMISGELDISVGAVVGASAMTLVITSGFYNMPMIIGLAAALSVGLLTGFVNGLLVTRTNVPSFIVTLATGFALSGLVLGLSRVITGTTSVPIHADPVSKLLFGTLIDNKFEVAIIWWIVVIVVIGWVLHFSRYGNWIFALGGDVVSARAAGIPVEKVKISLFMTSGGAASLVGIITAILYNNATVNSGTSYVFNSIIAVVIGGVLLTGGYGSVIGVVFGTLTFAIVNQGIYYTGWNSDWASLILGILLLVAVVMNNTFRNLALSAKPTTKKGRS